MIHGRNGSAGAGAHVRHLPPPAAQERIITIRASTERRGGPLGVDAGSPPNRRRAGVVLLQPAKLQRKDGGLQGFSENKQGESA
jgi:hypothetical protein